MVPMRRKSPARAGLSPNKEKPSHTRCGSEVPRSELTARTRKGKAAKEKPRVRERG
jgi:hypothetical protein